MLLSFEIYGIRIKYYNTTGFKINLLKIYMIDNVFQYYGDQYCDIGKYIKATHECNTHQVLIKQTLLYLDKLNIHVMRFE